MKEPCQRSLLSTPRSRCQSFSFSRATAHRREPVMAFAKSIGPHIYGFAGNAFNRIAATIDAG